MDAGLAADTVAGILCSTAAFEAALAGCPLVMYDPADSSGHPVCGKKMQTYFKTMADFRARIERHLGVEAADPLREQALSLLDTLRDSRAALRIGAFIAGYLEGAVSGNHRDKCLEKAIVAFTEQGGAALELGKG